MKHLIYLVLPFLVLSCSKAEPKYVEIPTPTIILPAGYTKLECNGVTSEYICLKDSALWCKSGTYKYESFSSLKKNIVYEEPFEYGRGSFILKLGDSPRLIDRDIQSSSVEFDIPDLFGISISNGEDIWENKNGIKKIFLIENSYSISVFYYINNSIYYRESQTSITIDKNKHYLILLENGKLTAKLSGD